MGNSQKGNVNLPNWNHARGITEFQIILIPKWERRREINYAWYSELQSRVHDWIKVVAKHNWERRFTLDKRLHCVLTRAYMRQGHPLVVTEKKSGELTEVIATYRKELSPRSKSDYRILSLLSYSKRQVIFAFRLNWSTLTSRPFEWSDATDKNWYLPTDSGVLSLPAYIRTPPTCMHVEIARHCHLGGAVSSWRIWIGVSLGD